LRIKQLMTSHSLLLVKGVGAATVCRYTMDDSIFEFEQMNPTQEGDTPEFVHHINNFHCGAI